MKKSNIIDTFIDRRKAQILEQEEDDDIIYDDLFEQSVDLSRFAMHLIEAGLEEYGVDFNYKENPPLRSDMFGKFLFGLEHTLLWGLHVLYSLLHRAVFVFRLLVFV